MENPATWDEMTRLVADLIEVHHKRMQDPDRVCGLSLPRMITDTLKASGYVQDIHEGCPDRPCPGHYPYCNSYEAAKRRLEELEGELQSKMHNATLRGKSAFESRKALMEELDCKALNDGYELVDQIRETERKLIASYLFARVDQYDQRGLDARKEDDEQKGMLNHVQARCLEEEALIIEEGTFLGDKKV